MTIHQRIARVFEDADIPGFLQGWRATQAYPVIPDQFCAYILKSEECALSADDRWIMKRILLHIHIYGKADTDADYARLERSLIAHHFRITRVCDLDDVRAGEYRYHKAIETVFYTTCDDEEE